MVVAHSEYRLLAHVETKFAEIPEVRCNVSELNRVFLNLIINAAHAILESGKDATTGVIAVRTSVGGGTLSFETRFGEGTTLFVRLPVDGSSESGVRTPSAAA